MGICRWSIDQICDAIPLYLLFFVVVFVLIVVPRIVAVCRYCAVGNDSQIDDVVARRVFELNLRSGTRPGYPRSRDENNRSGVGDYLKGR